MVKLSTLDILFVYYEIPKYKTYSFLSKFPIGLFALSSYVSNLGYSPGVWSGTPKELKQLLKIIEDRKPKIIGFYLHYDNFFDVLYLCRKLKKEYSDIKFIAGGPQAYVVDEEDFATSGLDAVVLGEGEYPVFKLCQYFIDNSGSLSDIPALKYMQNQKLTTTGKPFIFPDLDSLPIPHLEHALYPLKLKSYPISSGRGCPFKCSFCYEGYNKHKKPRFRSASSIKQELKNVFKYHNPKYLIFVDDTFTLNRSRLIEIANLLKDFKSKHDFVWFCESHIKTLMTYEDILPLLFEAGLRRIQLGIESGDNMVLELYKKQTSRELIENAVSIITEKDPLRCQITGNFILGGPEESSKTVEKSMKLADKLLEMAPARIDISTVFLSLYPFTPISQNPNLFGLKSIIDKKGKLVWNSMSEPVTETESITKDDLIKIHKEFNDFLKQKMISLIPNIPKDVLKAQYELLFKYGVYSGWLNLINAKYTYIYRYFSFIFEHEFKEISSISSKEISSIRPLRTTTITIFDDGLLELKGAERRVFELCTGKLTLKDITLLTNINTHNLIEILKKLEDNYLVVGVN